MFATETQSLVNYARELVSDAPTGYLDESYELASGGYRVPSPGFLDEDFEDIQSVSDECNVLILDSPEDIQIESKTTKTNYLNLLQNDNDLLCHTTPKNQLVKTSLSQSPLESEPLHYGASLWNRSPLQPLNNQIDNNDVNFVPSFFNSINNFNDSIPNNSIISSDHLSYSTKLNNRLDDSASSVSKGLFPVQEYTPSSLLEHKLKTGGYPSITQSSLYLNHGLQQSMTNSSSLHLLDKTIENVPTSYAKQHHTVLPTTRQSTVIYDLSESDNEHNISTVAALSPTDAGIVSTGELQRRHHPQILNNYLYNDDPTKEKLSESASNLNKELLSSVRLLNPQLTSWTHPTPPTEILRLDYRRRIHSPPPSAVSSHSVPIDLHQLSPCPKESHLNEKNTNQQLLQFHSHHVNERTLHQDTTHPLNITDRNPNLKISERTSKQYYCNNHDIQPILKQTYMVNKSPSDATTQHIMQLSYDRDIDKQQQVHKEVPFQHMNEPLYHPNLLTLNHCSIHDQQGQSVDLKQHHRYHLQSKHLPPITLSNRPSHIDHNMSRYQHLHPFTTNEQYIGHPDNDPCSTNFKDNSSDVLIPNKIQSRLPQFGDDTIHDQNHNQQYHSIQPETIISHTRDVSLLPSMKLNQITSSGTSLKDLPVVRMKVAPLLNRSGYYPVNLSRLEPVGCSPGPLAVGTSRARRQMFLERESLAGLASRLPPEVLSPVSSENDSLHHKLNGCESPTADKENPLHMMTTTSLITSHHSKHDIYQEQDQVLLHQRLHTPTPQLSSNQTKRRASHLPSDRPVQLPVNRGRMNEDPTRLNDLEMSKLTKQSMSSSKRRRQYPSISDRMIQQSSTPGRLETLQDQDVVPPLTTQSHNTKRHHLLQDNELQTNFMQLPTNETVSSDCTGDLQHSSSHTPPTPGVHLAIRRRTMSCGQTTAVERSKGFGRQSVLIDRGHSAICYNTSIFPNDPTEFLSLHQSESVLDSTTHPIELNNHLKQTESSLLAETEPHHLPIPFIDAENSSVISSTPRPIPRLSGQHLLNISDEPSKTHLGHVVPMEHHLIMEDDVLLNPLNSLQSTQHQEKNIYPRDHALSVMSFGCQVSTPNHGEMDHHSTDKLLKKKLTRQTKKSQKERLQTLGVSNKKNMTDKIPLTYFPLSQLPQQFINKSRRSLEGTYPLAITSYEKQSDNNSSRKKSVSSKSSYDKQMLHEQQHHELQPDNNARSNRPKRIRQRPLRWWLLERIEYRRPDGSDCPVPVGVHRRTDQEIIPSMTQSIRHETKQTTHHDIYPHQNKVIRPTSTRVEQEQHHTSYQQDNNNETYSLFSSSHSSIEEDQEHQHMSVSSLKKTKKKDFSLNKKQAIILHHTDIQTSAQHREESVLPHSNEHKNYIMKQDDLTFVQIDSDNGPFEVAIVFETEQYTVCELILHPGGSKGIDKTLSNLIGLVVKTDAVTNNKGVTGHCLLQIGKSACELPLDVAIQHAHLRMFGDNKKQHKKRKKEDIVLQDNGFIVEYLKTHHVQEKKKQDVLCLLLGTGHQFHIPPGTHYNLTNLSTKNPIILSLTLRRLPSTRTSH